MSFEDNLKKKEENKKKPEKAINTLMPKEEQENTPSTTEDDFLSKLNKKVKVEDTHSRHTFLVDNKLLDRLDKLARGRRGFKKDFINQAIKEALDKYEDKIK